MSLLAQRLSGVVDTQVPTHTAAERYVFGTIAQSNKVQCAVNDYDAGMAVT